MIYLFATVAILTLPGAAKSPPVEFPSIASNEPVELVWKGGKFEARMALLVPAKVDIKLVTPLPFEVRWGAVPRPLDLFQLKIEGRPGVKDVADLVFSGDATKIEPGEYSAAFRFSLQSTTSSVVKVKLSAVAAQLKADKLIVVAELHSPFAAPENTISIRETGGRTGLVNVKFTHAVPKLANGGDSTGKITCAEVKKIEAGTLESSTCRVPSEFELGTVTGTLNVHAEGRDAALDIPFEVRTKRHGWTLLLVIAIGIVVGIVLRQYLEPKLTFDRAALSVAQYRDELLQLQRAQADELIQNVVRDAVQKLNAALRSRKVAQLESVKTAIEGEIAAAKTRLEAARAELEPKLKETRAVIQHPRLFDPLVGAMVDRAFTGLAGVSQQFTRGEVSAAARGLETIYQQLNTEIAGWGLMRAALLKARRDARGAAFGLPANADPVGVAAKDAASLALLLDVTSAADEKLAKEVAGALTSASKDLNAALARIEALKIPEVSVADAQHKRALYESAFARVSMPSALLDGQGPVELLKSYALEIEHLVKLIATLRGRTKEEIEKVDAAVSAGRYAEAVSLLTAAAPPSLGGPRSVPSPGFAPIAGAFRALETRKFDPLFAQPSEFTVPRLELEIGRLSWISTAVSALVLLGIGYLIFAETFVGTERDFGAAFLWGFTTDIGLASILALAPKFQPK